jgi:RimJ/RimL family protein N-acetyltransferase
MMGSASLTPTAPFRLDQLIVRPLTADDSAAYRQVRQKILAIGDGKYFSSSYTRENGFKTEEQWHDWCAETQEHCTMGTFCGGKLIGIMGIVRYGPPENCAVEWEATWLDPEYRRSGVARLAYEKVQQWTKDHGYKYAVVLIRDQNTRSREIRERQGAVYMHTKRDEMWADGSVGDVHYFILDVWRSGQGIIQGQAIQQLEAIFASLEHDQSMAIARLPQEIDKRTRRGP